MSTPAHKLALRLLVYGLLLSWLVKWDFFLAAAAVYRYRPLQDTFFPPVLQSFALLACALYGPVALAFFSLLRDTPRALRASLGAFLLGSLVLLWHQGSYNDATFVTSFWVALWGTWFATTSHAAATVAPARAAFLAQLVLALMFFGGAVGKLTPGYFDGSVMYGVYFAERDHFSFAWLRAMLAPEQLRAAAQAYSLSVVALEWLLAALPLFPLRASFKLAIAAFSGLVFLNNFRLLSVVGPLIALCVVALYLTSARGAQSASSEV